MNIDVFIYFAGQRKAVLDLNIKFVLGYGCLSFVF